MTIRMIEFQTTKGTLRGALHLPDAPGQVPGVLLLHGFTGHRNESHAMFVKMSRRLEQCNIASLRFDFYGSGESDGDFKEVTLPGELHDAQRALEFLEGIEAVDARCIGVLGMSMGAAVAAALAGRSPSIRSVVLWGAVARIRRLFEASMTPETWDRLHREGFLDYRANLLGKGLFDTMDEIDPRAELRKTNAPCLIVHGEGDETVPPDDAELLFAAAQPSGRRVEKVIIAGADHTFSSVENERRVIEMTADWFCGTL